MSPKIYLGMCYYLHCNVKIDSVIFVAHFLKQVSVCPNIFALLEQQVELNIIALFLPKPLRTNLKFEKLLCNNFFLPSNFNNHISNAHQLLLSLFVISIIIKSGG